jgi:hypothetical protein
LLIFNDIQLNRQLIYNILKIFTSLSLERDMSYLFDSDSYSNENINDKTKLILPNLINNSKEKSFTNYNNHNPYHIYSLPNNNVCFISFNYFKFIFLYFLIY